MPLLVYGALERDLGATYSSALVLLGLAALQTVGLRSNQMATMRTTATQAAYDITDRMRANPDGLTEASQFYVIGTGDNAPLLLDCDANACTSEQHAQFDLFQWRARIQNALPDGLSSITQTVDAGTGLVTHTITVFWNEERDPAATGTGCDPQCRARTSADRTRRAER